LRAALFKIYQKQRRVTRIVGSGGSRCRALVPHQRDRFILLVFLQLVYVSAILISVEAVFPSTPSGTTESFSPPTSGKGEASS